MYTCSSFNTFFIQVCPSCHLPHSNTIPPFLPIQTSPNWPLPSFLISWRDSRGISHISLVFTDKSASLGMPRLQLPIKRQHSPAALSKRERGRRDKQAGEAKNETRAKENRREKSSECRDKEGTRQAAYALMQLTGSPKTKVQRQKEKQNRHEHTFWAATSCTDTKNRGTAQVILKINKHWQTKVKVVCGQISQVAVV